MKITVCIKQVPGTSEVKMDDDGNLIRDPSNVKMNPFDLFAIEAGLRIKSIALKENSKSTLTAISMGPPQAKLVIKEAFMMGADRGFLISDRKFAGSDVWATGYTLSQGILKDGVPDLIICGQQTTDGDTAQVGAELAEFLNIPHLTNVIKIVEIKLKSIVVECDLPTKIQVAELSYPCLITVNKDIHTPRLPSYKRKKETKNRKIEVIPYTQLEDKNTYHYGMKGSPTKVKRIFLPDPKTDRETWTGSPDELAEKLYQHLNHQKFL
jgi:lactate dehydrogenase (NAD+,ferredoxin) subunit LctB